MAPPSSEQGLSTEYLARVDAVEVRLRRHAAAPSRGGLTAADPATGERWDHGQVFAHLAEFVPYWIAQARTVLAAPGDGAAFGRVKSDAGRLAAIARDRDRPAAELFGRLQSQLVELRDFLRGLDDAQWRRTGAHPTLGVMPLAGLVEEFLVGHLEQHADQLDALAGAD